MAKGVAFPPEFRAEAVRMFRASGRSLTSVARELNISVESLSRWTKQAEIDEGRAEGLTSEERDELRRLRRDRATPSAPARIAFIATPGSGPTSSVAQKPTSCLTEQHSAHV